jgi:hypothetical protein
VDLPVSRAVGDSADIDVQGDVPGAGAVLGQVMALPVMRNATPVMNLPVNFEDSPLMKESYDRVRAAADADRLVAVITETLQRKFPNDVPSDLKGRLTALSGDELDAMFKRSIEANSADEILAVSSPATSIGH